MRASPVLATSKPSIENITSQKYFHKLKGSNFQNFEHKNLIKVHFISVITVKNVS